MVDCVPATRSRPASEKKLARPASIDERQLFRLNLAVPSKNPAVRIPEAPTAPIVARRTEL